MKINRRDFLKIAGGYTLIGAGSGLLLKVAGISNNNVEASQYTGSKLAGIKRGMVIDLDRCTGCERCVEVCREVNNVAMFDDKRIDNYWIRIATLRQKFPGAKKRYIPLLCNHCEEPFCVKVCLVKASFKREDGIVLIDMHRCIGCRYCMIVCPYKARSFVFKEPEEYTNPESVKREHGVVEKCNFCVSRIDNGLKPACVENCPNTAMVFGDINDPESEISRLIATKNPRRIRPDLGSKPKVYYIGL